MRVLTALMGAAALLTLGSRAPRLAATATDPQAPFPDVLSALLGLTLVAVAAWTVLVLTLSTAGHRGRRLALALTPRILRGTLLVAFATTVATGPALADDSLDGLRLPERATTGPSESAAPPKTPARPQPTTDRPAPEATRPVPAKPRTHAVPDVPDPTPAPGDRQRVVVVRPGDTLWGLAGQQIRRDRSALPSSAAIAHQVERWHRANAATIGPDPDLIRPGQRLTVPQEQS